MDVSDPLLRRYYQNRLLKDKAAANKTAAATAANNAKLNKSENNKPKMEARDRWTALFAEIDETLTNDSKLSASTLALDQDHRKRFRALARNSEPKLLETQFLQLMTTRDHPLCTAIESFTALFRELYSRQAGVMETTKLATATLEKAVENVRVFIEKLCTLTIARYPEIDTHQKRETCRQSVQEALFPAIYTDLFAIYQRKHFYRDAEFLQKLYALQVITSRELGVSDYLCLEDIIAAAATAAAGGTATNGVASPSATVTASGNQKEDASLVAGSYMSQSTISASYMTPPNGAGVDAAAAAAAAANGVSPSPNKLRPKKDWRGAAVRKLTNKAPPPTSKTMSLPRSATSFVPNSMTGGFAAAAKPNGSGGVVTTVAPAGSVIGTGFDLLSRSPHRAAAIEQALLGRFSPGKPPPVGSGRGGIGARFHAESSSLHIQNLKLAKDREKTEKQATDAQRFATAAVSVAVAEDSAQPKKQVGFMTAANGGGMGWGAVAMLNKTSGFVPPPANESSPDLFDTSTASLLSSSVPVFSLEHGNLIPAGATSGVAPSGSNAATAAAAGVRTLPAPLIAAGSPQLPTTPNPTPIVDSAFRRQQPFAATNGHAASPLSSNSTLSPAAQLPSATASPLTGDSSPVTGSPAGSASASANSSPVNIRRLDALPPPNFNTTHNAFVPPATSVHTTILTGDAPHVAAVTAAASAAIAAHAHELPATAAAAGAPPPARPAPASGLAAALSQAGFTKKLAAVDPEATNPYRTAIDALKRLSEQKTPREKLHCIVVMSEDICTCVDECYKRLNIVRSPNDADKLCICADDLLSLFAFLLIKSKLGHVISEANFIDDFVGDGLKLAMPGYFLATLQAAIELIGKIDKKSLAANNTAAATATAANGKDSKYDHSRRSSISSVGGTVTSASGTVTRQSRTGSDASQQSPTGSIGSRHTTTAVASILRDIT